MSQKDLMAQLTSDHLPSARVNRARRWLVWIAFVLLVPLSLFGWRALRENNAKRRLQAILQKTESSDPGWRLQKFQEEYELREVDLDLTKAIQNFNWSYGGSFVVSQPWRNPNIRLSSEQLISMRNRLDVPQFSTVRQFFQRYADQPQRRFADDYRGTPRQRTALRKQIDDLTRYASDEILLALHENRNEEAISFVQSQRSLLRPFDACPNLTFQGQRHQLLLTCAINVQTILAKGTLSEKQLGRLQQALAVSDKNNHLLQLRMIRAEANEMLEKMRSDSLYRDDCFSTYFNTPLPNSASWYEHAGSHVEDWYRQYRARDTLIEAQAEVLEALEDVIEEVRIDSRKVIIRMTWPVTNHIAQRVLSDNYSTIYSYGNAEAMIRSALVAVACERYRLKTNNWPKSLEELLPQYLDQVPLDPYTGKPLLYRILPDGVVVYSVGLDLKDDGGDVLPTGRNLSDRGVRLYDPGRRGLTYVEGQ